MFMLILKGSNYCECMLFGAETKTLLLAATKNKTKFKLPKLVHM